MAPTTTRLCVMQAACAAVSSTADFKPLQWCLIFTHALIDGENKKAWKDHLYEVIINRDLLDKR